MAELPIVCTLSPEEVRTRREDLLAGLVSRTLEHVPHGEGYRLRFAPEHDILSTIAHVVDAERQCCRFLRFQIIVEPDGGSIWLDVTGPAGTRDFLAGLFDS